MTAADSSKHRLPGTAGQRSLCHVTSVVRKRNHTVYFCSAMRCSTLRARTRVIILRYRVQVLSQQLSRSRYILSNYLNMGTHHIIGRMVDCIFIVMKHLNHGLFKISHGIYHLHDYIIDIGRLHLTWWWNTIFDDWMIIFQCFYLVLIRLVLILYPLRWQQNCFRIPFRFN